MKKEYEFKFSIIMCVYNVEQYLEDSIQSVINQNIGFEENVHLIIVNDGTQDNSEEIILKYKNKYPKNITYVKKENGGISSAKNAGLENIKGEYVNFFDPDDKLSRNALKEVYNFFKYNKLYIDMVSLPQYMFEAKTGLHPKYKYIEKTNHIIDLLKEPHNFVLSSCTSFYKHEVVKDMRFNEEMRGAEDTLFNYQIYKNNPKIGFVAEKGVRYHYRQRKAKTSILDNIAKDKRGFITILNFLKLIDIDNLKDFEKEMIIYELRSRIFNLNKKCFDSEQEYEELLKEYSKYISAIEDEFIFYRSKWAENNNIKYLFATLKGENHRDLINKNIILKSNMIIKNYSIEKDNVVFECLFYKYGNEDFDLVCYDNKKIITEGQTIELDKPFKLMYGQFLITNGTIKKFVIPIEKMKTFKFAYYDKIRKQFYLIDNIVLDKYSKLILPEAGIQLLGEKYKLRIEKGRNFKVSNNKTNYLKYKIKTFLNIIKEYKYRPFLRLLSNKNKKYILINDRPEKAGDNGEALFRHIYENRDDLKKYTYFVISEKSNDYNRLKEYGNVVKSGSLKHKFLFLNSKIIYSSHTFKRFYIPFEEKDYKYYIDLTNYKFVWLQHGITKMDISPQANKILTNNDYVITALEKEKKEFERSDYLYEKGQVLLTGFARFDRLENKPENIITICPTWRKTLTGKILEDGTHEAIPGFEESDYYKIYSEILTSKKISKLLRKNGYKLKFVIHPGMNQYLSSFKKFETEDIYIIAQKDVNYSELFSETKLMITDYSSVYFDFVYMKKPMIHFHFDEEVYFTQHYLRGYFNERKDGFGDVLETPKEVIDKIEYYFKNKFKMEDKYLERVDKIFKYTDKNNCERILNNTLK